MAFADSVASAIDAATSFISLECAPFFDFVSMIISGMSDLAQRFTNLPPAILIVLLVAAAAFFGRWRLALLTAFCLVFILVFNLWAPAMSTLSLVLTAAFLALVGGVPVGLAAAEWQRVNTVVEPALDFMQTMPPFVLLVPAVFFFGVGTVPAVIATVFFAMALPVRLTAHGIRMMEPELIEAGEAFGANRWTILMQIKLPLAFRSIMAGVNQCIMMSLSMVIIASMIGSGGLGDEIIRSISRLQVGRGVEAGLGVVLLAILIDRFTKAVSVRFDPAR